MSYQVPAKLWAGAGGSWGEFTLQLACVVIGTSQSLTIWASPQGCLTALQLPFPRPSDPRGNQQKHPRQKPQSFYSLFSELTPRHFCHIKQVSKSRPHLWGRDYKEITRRSRSWGAILESGYHTLPLAPQWLTSLQRAEYTHPSKDCKVSSHCNVSSISKILSSKSGPGAVGAPQF